MDHTVVWKHNVSQVGNGDIVFYLSCGQIAPVDMLSRNKHNLVVHESALPDGKGWSPLTWQIIEGKNEIPITLFEAERPLHNLPKFVQIEPQIKESNMEWFLGIFLCN